MDLDATNPELLALHRLDECSVKLQREGKYLEALELMERALVLRQHFFGPDSDHVWRACKTVADMCNLLSMTFLQQEQYKQSFELLKKAEILSQRDERAKAVTYNNLACFYRRKGNLRSALKYLQLALKIEKVLAKETGLEAPLNRADTHLNLCAVLSQLGRHSSALEQAQTALILLQEELFSKEETTEPTVSSFGTLNNSSNSGALQDKEIRKDRAAVLAIAYHNVGVEQEFLRKLDYALESYQKGIVVGEKFLGNKHGVTLTLKNSANAAARALKLKTSQKPPNLAVPNPIFEDYQKQVFVYPKKRPTVQQKKTWKNLGHAYGSSAYEIRPLNMQHSKSATVSKLRKKEKGKHASGNLQGMLQDSIIVKTDEAQMTESLESPLCMPSLEEELCEQEADFEVIIT